RRLRRPPDSRPLPGTPHWSREAVNTPERVSAAAIAYGREREQKLTDVTGHDKKILIALPFAEMARNILRTETFPTLLRAPGVHTALAVAAPLNSEFVREFEQSGVQLFRLPEYNPTPTERVVNSVRRGQLQRLSS